MNHYQLKNVVANVNKIIGPALIENDLIEQTVFDNFMLQQLDETQNDWGWCKQKLGVNVIFVVSLIIYQVGAKFKNITPYKHITNFASNQKLILSVPAFNVIKGGSHPRNKLAMLEFMILPVGASSFKGVKKRDVEVYHHLQTVIEKKYGQNATNVCNKGDFAAPNIQENKEGLELLRNAFAKTGYTYKIIIGMNVVASEFYGPLTRSVNESSRAQKLCKLQAFGYEHAYAHECRLR
ncbi:enolase-like [Hibiscus syriacus]|uniref:enolase-like n=1 Tax=Hibiscus syriacus TaxID=106335 RepID=UPI001920E549|nr:enolase-like [Hibiscus syriacus]